MTHDRDYDRPARARRYRSDDRFPVRQEVSWLGIVALVFGIKALVVSLIPCFGAVALFTGGFALLLAGASVLVARNSRQGMGLPVAATVVSSLAVAFSLLWVALFGAMFGITGDRSAARPAQPLPPPQVVQPQPNPVKKKVEPQLTDEQFEKQVLENLAKDRIKETIRNGPGLPVTAEQLDADYRTNVAAAEARYDGQVLAVTGKVVRVVREGSQTRYTLNLEAGTGIVTCEFTESAQRPLAALERGQTVTVRGLCTGRAGEVVKIKDCVLAK